MQPVIKNLLKINNWNEIKKNDYITDVIDNTNKGIGKINITHKIYGNVVIQCDNVAKLSTPLNFFVTFNNLNFGGTNIHAMIMFSFH